MNWLDIAIIMVVGAFAFSGFRSGLVREAITLLAVIVSIVVAGLLYDNMANDVLSFVEDRDVAEVISFLVLFGAVNLFGQIVAYTVKAGVSLLMLGWADRAGGLVFGLVKGLIVVEILLIVFGAYPELGLDGAVAGSEVAPVFVEDVDFVLLILPDNFEDRVDAFLAG